jgi:hypothetical protein
MMTEIRCEGVSRGLRPEERLVMVRDAVSGRRSWLRVETEYLTHRDGNYYLPVGVVQQGPDPSLALVELSQDPDAGNRRLCVRTADFLPHRADPVTCRSEDNMEQIRCEKVSPGLREEERSVAVRNAVTGLRSSLRVEADFLTFYRGHHYITVGVVQEEPQHGLLLVELPQEPDAGTTRLWVRATDTLTAAKASA